ncbi:MAG: amino acid ABC transporter substrate-binding protein [Cyanobacteria bacterium J06600_6]
MSSKDWYSSQGNLGSVIIKNKINSIGVLILGLALSAMTGCSPASSDQTSTAKQETKESNSNRLETIANRGELICGINDALPGFSYQETDGSYSGISVDLCKAIAAAIFGDSTKVKFQHLESAERFQAVVSGEVDILSRNTTWNLSRDTAQGLGFPPTNFYDGQGLLVKKESGIIDLNDLNGKSICFPVRTTTEKNLVEQMRRYNIGYLPMPFDDNESLYRSYEQNKCDAVTSDRSALVARRKTMNNPDEHQVLDAVISKEPLGPVIADGEPAWFDVVEWVFYATVKAEELDINSNNIDRLQSSKNPEVRRFLGMEGNLGTQLKLPNDFAFQVIKQVGNYDEIYQRNFREPFGLERGRNALSKDGGLMYSPPFR